MKCIHCGRVEDHYLSLNPEGECPTCIEYERDDLKEKLIRALQACEAAKDGDPCSFDHHGDCQAHRCGNPCEQNLIAAVLLENAKLIKENPSFFNG